MASFCGSDRLFISYDPRLKGANISPQRLSSWIVSTIKLCYELSHKPLPSQVRAHSTRAVSSSTAFLRGVPLDEVCRAATWSQPSTFVKHYRLDTRAKASTSFGRAVLSQALP
ncbi:hypothetical protein JRQ81_002188 [Phrynocephalus forsythii]|uniref:Tyr recombinase domain-containing protein n=1 Tax=Phrynocephalus forsythii TaxID=171643 RepID=A0A9Q0XI58_9SAUR|nr:hypothetical protein JRQ81_002188 [Phrynocephalus forsythii]